MLAVSLLPALLRWPLVLAPLYAAVVALVLVVLLLAWLDGREPGQKPREYVDKALGPAGRGRH
jgi:hypothetical protein